MSNLHNLSLKPASNEAQIDTAAPRKTQRKRYIPENPLEMIAVGRECLKHWRESGINMLWIQPDEFEQMLHILETNHTEKEQANIDRRPITRRLRELDKIIDKKLRFVKDHIAEHFSNNHMPPEEFFRDFGIEHLGRAGYKLPIAREKRANSLKLMIAALQDNNISGNIHGIEFWQNISNEYSALFVQTFSSDSRTKLSMKNKADARRKVRKTLQSLAFVIKGVYPDNYKDMLRIWGFQREKY